MREIKFRCWDNLTKRMHPQNGLLAKIEFDNDNKIFAVGIAEYQQQNEEGDCDWELFELKNQDESILMQFTGLIDKHGKEIYEGDVIQYYLEDGIAIAQIVFDENEDEGTFLCGFNCRLLNNIDYPDEEYDARELEVIGNIYENPELLGNKGELK